MLASEVLVRGVFCAFTHIASGGSTLEDCLGPLLFRECVFVVYRQDVDVLECSVYTV